MVTTAFLAAAAVAVAAAAADGTSVVATPAAGKPKSLILPDFWPAGSGTNVIGSASGRGWIGFGRGDGESRSTLFGSLRRPGGNSSFAKAALTRSQTPMMIVGSNLVYHSTDVSGRPGELRTAPLLANGRVGPPTAVPVDPESILPHAYPNDYNPLVQAGVQVGDRFVWVITGAKETESGGIAKTFLWACCTSAGEFTSLSRFIDHKRGMFFLQLGRDTKGRLWLAWLDLLPRNLWGPVRMVELDPDTLAPRTPKTFLAPAPGYRPELVCADHCRIVSQDLGGDIFTWAPGERSATRMGLGTRQHLATLLAAAFRPGVLEVASVKAGAKLVRVGAGFRNELEISVVRGDARGSHARRVGSVGKVPDYLGDSARPNSVYNVVGFPTATFVPGGLVYFQGYSSVRSYTKTRLLVGFLPFTG